MLADIKAGKIKRVIVKDMSRFGRDYLQVGMYTDILFPDFGVHFIAVNDGVDSTRGENEFTAIRNVFNEMYARDTSKKIRATGKTGTFAPLIRSGIIFWKKSFCVICARQSALCMSMRTTLSGKRQTLA